MNSKMVFLLFLGFLLPLSIDAQDDKVKKLKERLAALQEQVALIEGRVSDLEAENELLNNRVSDLENASEPLFLEVHCPGDSIMEKLEEAEGSTGPVNIKIFGTCSEEVLITRDNVTLEGAADGEEPVDELQAPSAESKVIRIDGARNVNLHHLKITGGHGGISVSDGASFYGDTLWIEGAGWAGVEVGNAIGTLNNIKIVK